MRERAIAASAHDIPAVESIDRTREQLTHGNDILGFEREPLFSRLCRARRADQREQGRGVADEFGRRFIDRRQWPLMRESWRLVRELRHYRAARSYLCLTSDGGRVYDAKAFFQSIAVLNRQAATAEIVSAIAGLLLGGTLGWFAVMARGYAIRPGAAAYAAAVVGLAGGLIGYLIGRAKAFAIRLRAHELSCLAAIEANTRR